jgi:predicted nucleic acid-binding protein
VTVAGLVIDASVAVKWFIAEDRSAEAQRILSADADLIAPTSILYEIFHALWDGARTGRLPANRLSELADVVPTPFALLVPMEQLYAAAAAIAQSQALAIYDCAYVALAQREHAELITADERMFAVARKVKAKARLL